MLASTEPRQTLRICVLPRRLENKRSLSGQDRPLHYSGGLFAMGVLSGLPPPFVSANSVLSGNPARGGESDG